MTEHTHTHTHTLKIERKVLHNTDGGNRWLLNDFEKSA